MKNDIGEHPSAINASHHGEIHHEIDSLRNFQEVKPIGNSTYELFFDVGQHRCTATVSGSTVNLALAVMMLSIPSTSHLSRGDYAELQQQRQLALEWAQQLVGCTPLIVEPWHSSGPTRRRSHEG